MTASATLEGGPEARVERTFPALDGARALAATAVLLHHVAFWTQDYTPDLVGRIFSRLDVGVAIFFVLSGFLLARPLFLAAVEERPAPRTAAYLWRRGLRILPAYWLTVVVALLVLPHNEGVAGAGTWLRHLTLTQIYGSGGLREGLSHTWSLCTEAAFYVLLPFAGAWVARLLRGRVTRPGRALAALGLATLLGWGWLVWIHAADAFPGAGLDLWLPAYAGWFAGGMALAVLSVCARDARPVRAVTELGASLPTCWAAAGALFWVATTAVAGPQGLVRPTAPEALLKNALYLGVAVLLVLPLVFGDQRQGWVRAALSSRAGRFLGDISYALFLVHLTVLVGGLTVLDLGPFRGNLFWVSVAVWVVSVAVAAVVYAVVERPLRRFRRLVPERPAAATTGAATAQTAPSARV
ncbi:UNVERIFIED_ORG: acyltransferase [Bacillus sp. AZ43]